MAHLLMSNTAIVKINWEVKMKKITFFFFLIILTFSANQIFSKDSEILKNSAKPFIEKLKKSLKANNSINFQKIRELESKYSINNNFNPNLLNLNKHNLLNKQNSVEFEKTVYEIIYPAAYYNDSITNFYKETYYYNSNARYILKEVFMTDNQLNNPQLNFKVFYEYNSLNLITLVETKNADGNTTNKITYEYQDSNLTKMSKYYLFNDTLVLIYRRSNYYDQNKRLIEERSEQFDYNLQSLVLTDKKTYEYYPNNLLKEIISYSIDSTYNLSPSYKETYVWNLTQKEFVVTGFTFENNSWKNSFKATATFNNNFQITSYILEEWDDIINNWVKTEKYYAEYATIDKPSLEIFWIWENNNWIYSSKNEYEYFGSKYMLKSEKDYYYDTLESKFKLQYEFERFFNSFAKPSLEKYVEYYPDNTFNMGKAYLSYDSEGYLISARSYRFYNSLTDSMPASYWINFENNNNIFSADARHLSITYRDLVSVPTNKTYQFELAQNYPNPFNPTTTIQFSIPETSFIELSVFDILGRKVAKLVEGKFEVGTHKVTFDATNLSSGIYFYKLKSEKFSAVKKMILMK
jgi:hypothetical protein